MKKILALILALGMLAATAAVGFADPASPEVAPEFHIVIKDNGGAFTTGSAAVGSSQEFTVKSGDEEYAPPPNDADHRRRPGDSATLWGNPRGSLWHMAGCGQGWRLLLFWFR